MYGCVRSSLRALLLAVGWLLLAAVTAGCGAGLITGAAASGGGGDGAPTARTPSLSIGNTVLPLVHPPDLRRSVIVTDLDLVAGAGVEVQLAALGLTVVQPDVVVTSQNGSTVVGFRLETAAIAAALGDPTAQDVTATLSVHRDGVPVAAPIAVLLARQPYAQLLQQPGQAAFFLSPLGQQVQILVDGLRAGSAADVEVLVSTPDPDGAPGAVLVRAATGLSLASSPTGVPIVTALLPQSAFPTRAEIVVRDNLAGESTPIDNAYYRPEVALALPRQGPTTGGTPLTLIGTALVPYRFGGAQPTFDFDRVELSFRKGGRELVLPRDDLRPAESGLDRLVFLMPPSPDGRPGQVDIVLRVDLDGVTAEFVASQVFLFANPDPFYGPRGAVIDQLPIAAVPIALDNAPGTGDAPDFALLTEQGGIGLVQLLLAQQNGMFQPFLSPRAIGDHGNPAERGPRDLLTGDFDGDQVPDLLVVNEGAASAVHHVVLGQARPLTPLGSVHRVPAAAGSVRGHVADFDGDGLPDVLLVPGPAAPVGSRPQVMLARPAGPGAPMFAPPIEVLVRAFAYEASEVADFDGDGRCDVAFVSGSELKLDVAYGNGDGTFGAAQALDFTVPGYTADPASRAVGLHGCRDLPHQSLGLVLAGKQGSSATPPTIVVLPQEVPANPPGAGWQFVAPTPSRVYTAPVEPFGRSMVANLDENAPTGGGPVELVVAVAGEPSVVALGLLQFDGTSFQPLFGSIEGGAAGGAESPVEIRSLSFATAFPATQLSGEAKAVFIVHEVDVDGVRERRLSTRLVTQQQGGNPLLLPPDAGAALPLQIEGLVAGDFSPISVAGSGQVRDLALVSRDGIHGSNEIDVVVNDGFGGFPGLGNSMVFSGLVPATVTRVPVDGEIEPLVFLADDSRLGWWRHDPDGAAVQAPDFVTAELRTLLPGAQWSTALLDDASRLAVADVDGDGVVDIVAMLSFDLPAPGEGDGALLLLRGIAAPAAGQFPFHLPSEAVLVHGNATSFALGDFVPGDGRLELALAVPQGASPGAIDGDHVRFYRYQAGMEPAADRFVPSAAASGPQVLLAGSEPTLCVAEDFDRDGLVDLLVACRGDDTLRLFRNTLASGAGGGGEVEVGAFEEALSSPVALAPGLPTELRLGDVNGDGNPDAVVWIESANVTGALQASIATYLNLGGGAFGAARFASTSRIGSFDARLVGDLGDWNRDAVPDLFLGWGSFAPSGSQVNLRVLFGGTR